MWARHCFLPSMMSWMLTSAPQPAQLLGHVPVQLLAPPVAIGSSPLSTGQRGAEAWEVVAEYLLDALSVRRCHFEQPEGGVEDRHQVAAGEVSIGEEVGDDLPPRRPVVVRQSLRPGFERLPFSGEIATCDLLPEVHLPPPLSLSMRDETYCHFAQNFASSSRPASLSA